MRATLAILVGLLMVWMQAVASVSPHLIIEQASACQCCKCCRTACATQTTVPAPTPSPVAASGSVSEKVKSSRPAQTPQERSASAEATGFRVLRGTASVHACPLPSLPLFERHCVRLI